MLRILMAILCALSFVLLGCSSGPRAISQTKTYVWGVEAIGEAAPTFVCKQMQVVIYRDRQIPNRVESVVVPDRYCSQMAKPVSPQPG